MRFNVMFKTPEAAEYTLDRIDRDSDDFYKARELLGRFIQYGETVNIEFDTDSETARVVEV